MEVTDISLKPFRKIIRNQKIKNNRDWDDIKKYPMEGQDLNTYLSMVKEVGFDDLDRELWEKLVDSEKEDFNTRLQLKQFSKQGMLHDKKEDNEIEIPTDEHSSWQLYRNTLENKGFDEPTIDVMEESTLNIAKRLSLKTPKNEPIKGLVVGNVQSGKTANMAALMAMLADRKWNFFIVLSGTIENLREQTEKRLFEDLASNKCNYKWILKKQLGPNLGTGERIQDCDFHNNVYFTVCLKNSTRLRNLMEWLKEDKNKLAQLRILLIDDESDQASINTANVNDEEEERKTINNLISGLVYCDFNNKKLRAELKNPEDYHYESMNYVGYTATPYANILNETPDIPGNLYPSSFITTLKVSPQYFGPQQIFGLEGDDNFQGLSINHIINNSKDEQEDITQCKDLMLLKDIHNGITTDLSTSLKDAIVWFICCVACQRVWDYKKPITMLIHTSQLTAYHENVCKAIKLWLQNTSQKELINYCKKIWNRETKLFNKTKLRAEYPLYGIPDEKIRDYPNYELVEEKIKEILSIPPQYISLDRENNPKYSKGIQICIDNGKNNAKADDDYHIRLIYPEKKLPFASAFIVIGGQTLARGLTLEGLVSSYFLRTTGQADTLMQMGRWFGYRKGYEILPRIWMTYKTQEKFFFLSKLDAELREDIETLQAKGFTPTDYGPRVTNTPDAKLIRITAKNRMQSATEVEWNFSGKTNQTFIFENDYEKLHSNIDSTEYFLSKIGDPSKITEGAIVWNNVDNKLVSNFLGSFYCAKRNPLYRLMGALTQWIDINIQNNNLSNWNVTVAGRNKAKDDNAVWILPNNLKINKVIRTKKNKEDNENIFDIGTLRAPKDMFADIDLKSVDSQVAEMVKKANVKELDYIRKEAGLSKTPLLVIYRIDKKSTVTDSSKLNRLDLNAVDDLIGICIYLPGEENGKNCATKLSIDLKHIEYEEDNGDLED